jgi:hypothetical protein
VILPSSIDRYLKSRAVQIPWHLDGSAAAGLDGAVVIPAYAEAEHLFVTLDSLAANPAECLDRFLVLVVVNNRGDVPAAERDNNLTTLRRLALLAEQTPLRLSWVDAATPGRDLPEGAGVGLARKIGLDLALSRLDYAVDPLLVCLDADTLVRPDYLPAIATHFARHREGGAVIPFCHQAGETMGHDEAIVRYELFLRSYVLGLSLAGSPYAFHTVGSAMACRASAYVRMGGMNSRTAGEDFYFLQQLQRTAGVAPVEGTVVFPSARASHRVPFGTGRSIGRSLGGDPAAVAFYRPECFTLLGAWLALVDRDPEAGAESLLAGARGISSHLANYLEGLGFAAVWERLQRNHPRPGALLIAFHGWFDGLRTMRLIHHLSAGPYPRCGAEEALPRLLRAAGLPDGGASPLEWLQLLRREQISAACRSGVCTGRCGGVALAAENFPPISRPSVV